MLHLLPSNLTQRSVEHNGALVPKHAFAVHCELLGRGIALATTVGHFAHVIHGHRLTGVPGGLEQETAIALAAKFQFAVRAGPVLAKV